MTSNAKSTQSRTVSFSITGEYLTDHARLCVLSKDWRTAIRILGEDIQGSNTEIALAVLKGEKKFIGTSGDEENPINLVDDSIDDPETSRYLDTLAFQNAGLLKVEGAVYRPRWLIEALGPDDYDFARKESGYSERNTREFMIQRAKYYAGNSGIEYHVTLPRSNAITSERVDLRQVEDANEWIVLWEPIADYPFWVNVHHDAGAAMADFLAHRSLDRNGADTTILDMKLESPAEYERYLRKGHDLTREEDEERADLLEREYQADLKQLRAEIEKQAGPKGGEGWMRLGVFNDQDKIYKDDVQPDYYLDVPKQPFLIWALNGNHAAKLGVVKEWRPICPSGMKMMNDDRFHTDWVVGAGLDPARFNREHEDVDMSAQAQRLDLCFELMNFEFAPLSKSDKRSVSGKVRFLKPGETLEKDQIGIIQTASVEYDAALRSAAKHGTALICITGGPLAHIAVVGREMNVPIILWDKAVHLFNGMTVGINLKEGKITVHGH